jgi:subtilisin family serine protease
VWARNITGKGVVVSVLDDGVEYTHPDLQRCYVCSHVGQSSAWPARRSIFGVVADMVLVVGQDAKASLDLNSRDKDPMPDTSKDINSHGTRCAGEIAAQVCKPVIARACCGCW